MLIMSEIYNIRRILCKYTMVKRKTSGANMRNAERKRYKMSLSVCGTDCSTCYCFGKMCKGCEESGGKVFHVPDGKACAIYECTVNNKGMKNCGECSEAPCDIWMKTRDPKYSDEEFAKNVRGRMQALKNAL